ncbi:ATP-binding cassette domain-containing protein [Kribbella jejuensis]|uniref:ABC-2 type transport system ATP-binding protein n=1 Tax=Kribbella jejuensis TaxID=236068 RepID=A0A542EPW5_9ACTN|nr:ATP-binding cassette domain-containing protein [Kribbella jejuensis]TQJ17246.1 ABC-2 type transport system ATP-binding protein [Kribbella jejuensis]
MSVIELSDVTRSFTVRSRTGFRRTSREVRAVDGLSFTVEPGEVVGYIGPNGAGKSTTIKMLTGILVPSGGTIRVAGVDPSRHRLKLAKRIGVVFGQRTTLWWDLPLKDSFAVLQKMYGVPAERHRANLATFVELLDLGDLLDVPVRQLSLGQRMRGDIAAALLHDPEIVYLDEPTIGLDVISKARLREFLAEVNTLRRTTIILTTHDLDDIEALCTRVMVIDHGHQIFDGTLDQLKSSQSAPRTLVVDLATSLPPINIPGATVVKVDGPRQHLTFPTTTSAAPLLTQLAANYPLVDLSLSEPTIESVITQLYTTAT